MELDNLINVTTSVAITTIVTIMTIALPLMITSMHRLVELYKTNYAMNIFNSDSSLKWFRVILIISVSIAVCWVILFFIDAHTILCYASIALCGLTLALLINLIILVARIVYYTLPNKFINVIFKKIDNSKTPKFYFSPEIYKYSSDKKEETKRLKKYYKTEEYDERTTFLFIVLARIYVTSNEISVRKEILKYWDDKCRKASLQKNDYNYYTNGFYNFIHEIETWAIEKEDKNLQIESIKFTNILLNAHLPMPRKLGERESDEDERVYISYETLKSLWRTIRTCIDAGDEEMFKRYWQIVNNMSSRKYESRFISKPKNFDDEKIKFLVLHFACCAYLIASKRYELLKYALEYSQSHPFHWELIPEKSDDIVGLYILTKQAYSNWQYEMDFTFSDDYNLYDKKKICYPFEQLAILLLFYSWNGEDAKNVQIEKKKHKFINNLISLINVYPEEMEWYGYLHMEDLDCRKEAITKYLNQLISEKKY